MLSGETYKVVLVPVGKVTGVGLLGAALVAGAGGGLRLGAAGLGLLGLVGLGVGTAVGGTTALGSNLALKGNVSIKGRCLVEERYSRARPCHGWQSCRGCSEQKTFLVVGLFKKKLFGAVFVVANGSFWTLLLCNACECCSDEVQDGGDLLSLYRRFWRTSRHQFTHPHPNLQAPPSGTHKRRLI